MLYILDRLKEMIIGFYERYYSEYSYEEGILCICFMIIEELLMIRLTGTCFDYWMMMAEGSIIMNEVNVVVRLLSC